MEFGCTMCPKINVVGIRLNIGTLILGHPVVNTKSLSVASLFCHSSTILTTVLDIGLKNIKQMCLQQDPTQLRKQLKKC